MLATALALGVITVGGAHLSFPGIGRLRAEGRGQQTEADVKDAGEKVKDAAGKVGDAFKR